MLISLFIRQGLDRGEKILYIADGQNRKSILDDLAGNGVPLREIQKDGHLAILDSSNTYYPDGTFDPDRMMAFLATETRNALDDGYEALRVAGEMAWALEDQHGAERMIEYAARLNAFLPEIRCLTLCLYDRRRFAPSVLLDVIATHPMVVAGSEFFENFYYLPPEDFLSRNPEASILIKRLHNLKEHKRAEERIRSLTEQLFDAQETERGMIARELHDRVAQDLSTMKLTLETLFDDLPAVPPPIGPKMLQLSGLLDHTIKAVRDLAYDMLPPGFEDFGIVQALETYCEDFSRSSGIHVEFQSVGIERLKLGFTRRINLYRIVQEGLNNIRKHADANRARVVLTAAHPHIILRIADNGRGFDVRKRESEIDGEKRMGLRSLQSRTQTLGGQMTVNSRPGEGTRIFIRIPQQGNGT